MSSATEILRIAASTDDQGKIKLLWHLHSFVVEKDGPARFQRELQEWFPDSLKELSSAGLLHNGLESAFRYLQDYSCGPQTLRKIRGLLQAHMERSEKEAREKFYLTNIGRPVWEALNWCLDERAPVFLEGLTGRGKSEAAKAWCAAHRGQARYATLDGFSTQREFFAALAEPWGLSHVHANCPGKIRYRVQDVITRAGLVVIIDEAHFALPERTQRGRPAIVDWINTALCNHGVSVALISTPQFGPRLSEFEHRTTYNADQFKRRFARHWTKLDDKTSEHDLVELTRRVLPQVGERGIDLAVNYAGTFDRDVSALFDLVKDAKRRARIAGRDEATFQDLKNAYTLDRIPSENALATAFAGAKKLPKKTEQQPLVAETQQITGSRAATDVFSTGTHRQQIESIDALAK